MIAGGLLGAAIDARLGAFGQNGIVTGICFVLGTVGGIVAQGFKVHARNIVTPPTAVTPPAPVSPARPRQRAPKTCPHCGARVVMRSFRLYRDKYVTQCPHCRRDTLRVMRGAD
jgi:hypothetical protein